jgi:hypothetical protein
MLVLSPSPHEREVYKFIVFPFLRAQKTTLTGRNEDAKLKRDSRDISEFPYRSVGRC